MNCEDLILKINDMFKIDYYKEFNDIINNKSINNEDRIRLIGELEKKRAYFGHNVTLGIQEEGYRCYLVNKLEKWREKGYEIMWGFYKTPDEALKAFIDYVDKNNIDVKSLMGNL